MRQRSEEELYWLALGRAAHGGEPEGIRKLREYTHAEMLEERIDGGTQDRIGELLDELARKEASCVGDLIGPNADSIPWDVLEVFAVGDNTTWRRAFREDRIMPEDEQFYDWRCEGGGSTSEGLLEYAPLRVTKVAHRPTEVPTPELVANVKRALTLAGPRGLSTIKLCRGLQLTEMVDETHAGYAVEWMRREGLVRERGGRLTLRSAE